MTGGLSWISIFVLIHWRVYKSIGLSSFSQYFEMVIRRGRCPIFRRTSLEAGQNPWFSTNASLSRCEPTGLRVFDRSPFNQVGVIGIDPQT